MKKPSSYPCGFSGMNDPFASSKADAVERKEKWLENYTFPLL